MITHYKSIDDLVLDWDEKHSNDNVMNSYPCVLNDRFDFVDDAIYKAILKQGGVVDYIDVESKFLNHITNDLQYDVVCHQDCTYGVDALRGIYLPGYASTGSIYASFLNLDAYEVLKNAYIEKRICLCSGCVYINDKEYEYIENKWRVYNNESKEYEDVKDVFIQDDCIIIKNECDE